MSHSEALKADGLNVKLALIDVTDSKSIAAAKTTIENAEGHLDVLVNNAGTGVMNKPQRATDVDVSVVREACEVNLFGLIETTTAFLPLLLKSKSTPTIVNVSTDMASNSYMASHDLPSFLHVVAYNTSKAAANSYTISLAHELKGKAVVIAHTPGFTTTKLNGHKEGGKTPKEAAEGIAIWALEDDASKTGEYNTDS